MAGETLEEHATERVQVSSPIDRLAHDLLRRHEVECAYPLPRFSEGAVRCDVFRQTEVGEVRVLFGREPEISTLAGFTSRCTDPRVGASSEATWATMNAALRTSSRPSRWMIVRQVRLCDVAHRGCTEGCRPRCPLRIQGRCWGWSIAAANRDSRLKRSRNAGSWASCGADDLQRHLASETSLCSVARHPCRHDRSVPRWGKGQAAAQPNCSCRCPDPRSSSKVPLPVGRFHPTLASTRFASPSCHLPACRAPGILT